MPTVNPLTHVATYCRVSTSEQAENGTSIENQTEQLRTYCKAQGWKVAQEYIDPGHTGKNADRPGLKRLLSDAKAGLFDKIVVYKLDRLSRNLRLLLELEETLKDQGVTLLSVKESVDTSLAIGRTVFQVLGLTAQWEREAIVERTRSGRLQRFKQGKWAGGKVAFGYTWDKDSSKFLVDEKEARVVKEIFKLYADGKSLNAIATMLNNEHTPTRSGAGIGWRSLAVRCILFNPMYKGEMLLNRNEPVFNLDKVNKETVVRVKVPAIVDEKLFAMAQKHLVNNKRVRPQKKEKWLLQGLLTCGLCGYSYKAAKNHKYGYYMCRGTFQEKHLDGSPRCSQKMIRADWLEKEVWSRIELIANDPNKLAPLLDEAIANLKEREKGLSSRLVPVEAQLADIASQKAKLADEWVRTNMEPSKYKELQSNLNRDEIRLLSIKSSIDPAQLADLEQARGMLRFWQREVHYMRTWNLENEDGSMHRTINSPHEAFFKMVGFEDMELSRIMGVPTYKRELLDKLQVQLVAFEDRIEVNSVFEIEPIYYQKGRTPSRWEGESK